MIEYICRSRIDVRWMQTVLFKKKKLTKSQEKERAKERAVDFVEWLGEYGAHGWQLVDIDKIMYKGELYVRVCIFMRTKRGKHE